MIVIDPRRTETADLADFFLQVRPGTDAFVLSAMLGVLVQEDLVDSDFLRNTASLGSGGALWATGAEVVATAGEVHDNHAGRDGGAFALFGGGSLTLYDTLLTGNHADDDGGAVHADATDRLDLLRVVAHGNDAGADVPGEVIVRGPHIMLGYWNRPEATAESIKDGWLHTGDVAVMDADGYVYIQDRIKDMTDET